MKTESGMPIQYDTVRYGVIAAKLSLISMVVIYHDPAAMRSLVDRTFAMREGRCNQLEVRGSA